jgi:hypothetical protein
MSDSIRNILVISIGAFYLIGAAFNFFYTRQHGEKFYAGFAESTWFAPSNWFIQRFVLPNPGIFTVTLILFQLFVGIALVSQGPFVSFGLLAGTAFCLYAVFVSNVPGAIANLALAVVQFWLASAQ